MPLRLILRNIKVYQNLKSDGKNNAVSKTVEDLRLFNRFKSIWICTGSKGAESVNIIATEKFPKDTHRLLPARFPM